MNKVISKCFGTVKSMGWFYKMKKWVVFLITALSANTIAWANNNCFIAKENGAMLKQEGKCTERHSPCSTFKIAISLMGFDKGILTDKTHPEWSFKEGYNDWLDVWKQPHNPTTWIQHSCVWYSQLITQKLGMEQFKHYIQVLNYGNQDVSGDKGMNNGLARAWLSGSLQISPQEQVEFLSKLTQNKLPVSHFSMQMTHDLLFVENLPGDWKLYGKTGSGNPFKADGSRNMDKQLGWFVGWIEKGPRTVLFAQYIEDDATPDYFTGKQAREIAKQKLMQLTQSN